MAKVTDFKFEIAGEKFVVHVNCDSGGQFNANLPKRVVEALDLKEKLTGKTLEELSKAFYAAIDRYKKAETKQELFILIQYKSKGGFNEDKEGNSLHGGYREIYDIDISFVSGSLGVLGFGFKICIKETVDKVEKWYNAQLGSEFAHWHKEEQAHPNRYYKGDECWNHEDWKAIPFSKAALDSLKHAKEKIRTVSEMLFKFIEQDEEKIQLILTKQKLLN